MSAINTLRECYASLQKRRDDAQKEVTLNSELKIQSQRRLDLIKDEIEDVLKALVTLKAS